MAKATTDEEAGAALRMLIDDDDFCDYVRDRVHTEDGVDAMRSLLDRHAQAMEMRHSLSGDALRESAAHRLTETNRCLRVVDDIIAAAQARRPDHHSVSWLHAVRTAIVDGLDPAAATAGINDAANAGEANHG